MRREAAARALATGQGAWFLLTGLWPLVDLASFEAVTGPKREGWLVKTAGVLIATIGATLLLSGRRGRVPAEVRLLGAASAAGLAGVDVWYAGVRRRIAPVYLADAVGELGLVIGWGIAAGRSGAAGAPAAHRKAAAHHA